MALSRTRRSTAGFALLAAVGLIIALFVLVFDRYVYLDYHKAQCEGLDRPIAAELVGRFEKGRPRIRQGPYNLKIELVQAGAETALEVRQLKMMDISSGANAVLTAPDSKIRKVVREDGVILFAVDDLDIPYEDYRLTGELSSIGHAAGKQSAFSCTLKRNRWTEWRLPWFDALMSV